MSNKTDMRYSKEEWATGRWVERRSSRGYPFGAWEQGRMARIPDEYLDCVIYIYESESDAFAGKSTGGSGFLVSMSSEIHQGAYFAYAVTNKHVIEDGGKEPAIRLNTQGGDKDVIPTLAKDWVKRGDDIAVYPIGVWNKGYKFSLISRNMFLTEQFAVLANVGPGDEAFLVGRFINHEGEQQNLPSVRWGNIAMMPLEPVKKETDEKQDSFLVEVRSIGGYSGSPVFLYIAPLAYRPDPSPQSESSSGTTHLDPIIKLLGVNWGHLHAYTRVIDDQGKKHPDGWRTKSNSGMATVVPAWKLADLLDDPKFLKQREKGDQEITKEKAERRGGATEDTAHLSENEEQPLTK